MAEEIKQPEEKPETPEGAKPEPKAGPDWERAANDYRAQRDAARKQVEDLQRQADELKASMEGLKGADDVQKAVDDALSKANADFERSRAQWAEREKALTVSNELAGKGCIDCAALLAHVDMSKVTVKDGKAEGVDVDGLKGSYPYLFGKRPVSGATDARPDGAPSGIDERLDKAFGLKEE